MFIVHRIKGQRLLRQIIEAFECMDVERKVE